MNERHNLKDTILSAFVPVHWDGHKFIGIAAAVTLVFFMIWAPLGWIGVLITAYIAYFFRDPPRVTPLREGLVIAPADGEITAVSLEMPPRELGMPEQSCTRISIFLSIFDVHINRSPADGRIIRKTYIPGLFLNAALDKASEDNEREATLIQTPSGDLIGVVRIAGLIARRIIAFVNEGQMIEAGARTGLIRFGSRVDVYIPANAAIFGAVGQRTIGGETVLADLRSEEATRTYREQ